MRNIQISEIYLHLIQSNLIQFSKFFYLQKACENFNFINYWVSKCAPYTPTTLPLNNSNMYLLLTMCSEASSISSSSWIGRATYRAGAVTSIVLREEGGNCISEKI